MLRRKYESTRLIPNGTSTVIESDLKGISMLEKFIEGCEREWKQNVLITKVEMRNQVRKW